MNSESVKPESSEVFPKRIADRMVMFKMSPNEEYFLVTLYGFAKIKMNSEGDRRRRIYDSYEVTDVQQEKDGSTTAINPDGKRVVLEGK